MASACFFGGLCHGWPLPPSRRANGTFWDEDPDCDLSLPPAALVADLDQFDPAFFQLPPAEAALTDPQQRLLLELSWLALEDALVPPAAAQGPATGMFAGVCNGDYRLLQASRRDVACAPHGALPSVVAGRVAYFLAVEGPVVTVDTACSASLVAVHLALDSLATGWGRPATQNQ